MLNIYIGKESLPEDKKFIFDVESVFLLVKITGSDFQRKVIEEIEHGSYYDNKRFKDRFGGLLYYSNMSTGSKALFEAEYLINDIINISECGENALRMLSYLNNGNVYFDRRDFALPWDIDYPVTCNGRYWERVTLLNDYLR